MTVSEFGDYDTLIPAGQIRPDGHTEWQDLGSLSSCPMAYLATALSSGGLEVPEPTIPLPGQIEMTALRELFRTLGIPDLPAPVPECHTMDDAFLGMSWTQLMDLKILGMPWYELAQAIAAVFPDLFPGLIGGMMDDFNELVMAVVTLCYYGDLTGNQDVLDHAKLTLKNMVSLERIFADIAYISANSKNRKGDPAMYAAMLKSAQENLYRAAVWGSQYGIEAPTEDFFDFSPGDSASTRIESELYVSDTDYWPLKTDEQIMAAIQSELDGKMSGEPWIVDRYMSRFSDGPPIRRAGDGYEAVFPGAVWMPTENPHHSWFSNADLLFETPMCANAPWIVSCDWARLGCERPDLDGSGVVDAADRALFDTAYAQYSGQTCGDSNGWCGGADLDRNGVADQSDQAFMTAADGCRR